MSESVETEPEDEVEAADGAAPFHDHRWHQLGGQPDTPDVFLCDECGVVWTL
jgi:hypothetical protein